jgi:alpha-glucosidase (family GH31 glycosyl hydrolase)
MSAAKKTIIAVTFLCVIYSGFEMSKLSFALSLNSRDGNPPICPRWALEPWVWEDNGNTRQSTEALVGDYLSRDIPVGVVLIDSPWSTGYNNFVWDTNRYPNPQEMINHFHAKNIKIVLWLTG